MSDDGGGYERVDGPAQDVEPAGGIRCITTRATCCMAS
jgi:hypothetical protein